MKMTKTTILITIMLTAALSDVRAQMRPMPIISPDSLVQTYTGRLAYMLLNRYVAHDSLDAALTDYLLRDSLDKALSGYVKTDDSRLSDSRTPTGAAGGDLTGNYPNPAIKSSVTLAGNPTVAGTLATTDSSNKVATTAFVKKMAGTTGPAGGDLTGTYPNPTIKESVTLTGMPLIESRLYFQNDRLGRSYIEHEHKYDDEYGGYDENLNIYSSDNINLKTNNGYVYVSRRPLYSDSSNIVATTAFVKHFVGTAGGDLVGTYPNPTIKPSVTLKGSPIVENKLYFNSTERGPSLQYEEKFNSVRRYNLKISASDSIKLNADNVILSKPPLASDSSNKVATTAFVKKLSSLGPKGLAGGDLTGKYPNPTIKPSVTLKGDPTITGNLTANGILTVNGTGESLIKGNLRLKGSSAYGNKINLGDGDYVYLHEATDDNLTIKAKNIDLAPTTSVTAPTPATSDNSTKVATTAYVKQVLGYENYAKCNSDNVLTAHSNEFNYTANNTNQVHINYRRGTGATDKGVIDEVLFHDASGNGSAFASLRAKSYIGPYAGVGLTFPAGRGVTMKVPTYQTGGIFTVEDTDGEEVFTIGDQGPTAGYVGVWARNTLRFNKAQAAAGTWVNLEAGPEPSADITGETLINRGWADANYIKTSDSRLSHNPATSDNSTQIATTAYVNSFVGEKIKPTTIKTAGLFCLLTVSSDGTSSRWVGSSSTKVTKTGTGAYTIQPVAGPIAGSVVVTPIGTTPYMALVSKSGGNVYIRILNPSGSPVDCGFYFAYYAYGNPLEYGL